MKKIIVILLILMALCFPARAYEVDESQVVLVLHDILMNNLEYDYEYKASSYTAEGALHTGKATCQGYALLLKRFLDMTGIENHVYLGLVDNELHSWNSVVIDKQLYFIDLTFNDTTNSHDYFMVNELLGHYLLFELY